MPASVRVHTGKTAEFPEELRRGGDGPWRARVVGRTWLANSSVLRTGTVPRNSAAATPAPPASGRKPLPPLCDSSVWRSCEKVCPNGPRYCPRCCAACTSSQRACALPCLVIGPYSSVAPTVASRDSVPDRLPASSHWQTAKCLRWPPGRSAPRCNRFPECSSAAVLLHLATRCAPAGHPRPRSLVPSVRANGDRSPGTALLPLPRALASARHSSLAEQIARGQRHQGVVQNRVQPVLQPCAIADQCRPAMSEPPQALRLRVRLPHPWDVIT